MTIGQRITYKRKQLSLSQEALGEALGVSRQAIYKWENDITLPEIEKLIALSRLFSVSVGWLLGVEDAEQTPGSAPDAAGSGQTDDTASSGPQTSDELSEKQLKMIEELVKRYVKSQPAPPPKKRWPFVLAAALILFLLFQVVQLKSQYQSLVGSMQNSIAQVSQDLGWQIGSLTGQVADILKAQNSLAADYKAELLSVNPADNTATFAVSAIPKTYAVGMRAIFAADSEGQLTDQEGTFQSANQSFSAEITCPLSDDILLSVTFEQGETRSTQILERMEYLWSESFPYISVIDDPLLFLKADPEGRVTLRERIIQAQEDPFGWTPASQIVSVEAGLFVNHELIAWGAPCERPDQYPSEDPDRRSWFFELPPLTLQPKPGDLAGIALRVTDDYGRVWMVAESFYDWNSEDAAANDWGPAAVKSERNSPDNWGFN